MGEEGVERQGQNKLNKTGRGVESGVEAGLQRTADKHLLLMNPCSLLVFRKAFKHLLLGFVEGYQPGGEKMQASKEFRAGHRNCSRP